MEGLINAVFALFMDRNERGMSREQRDRQRIDGFSCSNRRFVPRGLFSIPGSLIL